MKSIDILNSNKGTINKNAKDIETAKKKMPYPKGAFFVLGNEFAERFSFYGMRTLLVLYFVNIHLMPEHTAKVIYHTFVAVSYVTPLFGSLLADGFFGKYKVILFVSLLYVVGHLMMTLGAFFDIETSAALLSACDFGGLVLIAFANGGLKPCVPAFAGDQFPPSMSEQRKKFFSYFYSSVNYGALLSIVLTPILRSRVSCFGRDSCYALGFGVPTVFMLAAFVVFLIGRRYYVIIKDESVIVWKAIKCIFYAFFKLILSPGKSWTEHAAKKFDKRLIEDVKSLINVLIVFIPVVPFWALLDQQGSTWVLQANRMSGKIGQMTVLPDQMLMLNPLLVILLVPVFESVVYPLLAKGNFLVKPLRRMGWGGVFIASSFVVSGFLQIVVDRTSFEPLANSQSRFVILNKASCSLKVILHPNAHFASHAVPTTTTIINPDHTESIDMNTKSVIEFSYASTENKNCPDLNSGNDVIRYFNESSKKSTGYFMYVYNDRNGGPRDNTLLISYANFDMAKTRGGKSRIYFLIPDQADFFNVSVVVRQSDHILARSKLTPDQSYLDISPSFWQSSADNVYTVLLYNCPNFDNNCTDYAKTTYSPKTGEARIFIVPPSWAYSPNGNGNGTDLETVELINGNTVSIAWQFPQFLLITIGEIMFAVTGLEFSYSQASITLKSVVLALWYLNNAMGNLVAVIISGSKVVNDPVNEFFVYAILVYAATIIFSLVARRYKYVNGTEQENSVSRNGIYRLPKNNYEDDLHNENYHHKNNNLVNNKIPFNGVEMKQKNEIYVNEA